MDNLEDLKIIDQSLKNIKKEYPEFYKKLVLLFKDYRNLFLCSV